MAALTAPRSTVERSGTTRQPPVKAATVIFQGSMVAIDTSGWAVPAAATSTLKVIGRAEDTASNAAGANGDVDVRVSAGIYRWSNSSAGDAITRADIGADCYAVDDQTVAKTSATNTRPRAGKIFDVDSLGVWVDHR
ncbi:MAG: hypothetical protein JNM13_15735 [Hyphomicrobiaceae bacterium]|nr:hypothetical protein [Hyphomicrobiaceae bacterium]